MNDVFGIDLGTTNSCIAAIGEDGLPQVVKNLDDGFTTASVVFYGEDETVYVGTEAKNGMGENPEQAVAFIKREMSNKNYKRQIDDFKVSPVEVSALIIKKVVDDANEQRSYEGLPSIHKAVITVPAYFGLMERELTKQAGEIAGLEVLDLLNEPTAAALNYGTKGLDGKTFLIYDLGGGTFDVSIMRLKNGVLETLSTDGDHHLGGVDWDIALADYVLAKNGLDVTYEDIKDTRDGGKILLAAENCKKNLSKAEKAKFQLMYKRKPYPTDVSRSVFEELTEGLLDNTIDLIRHAIKISREPGAKIDEIILVGGSSYMPMVKNRLQKEFGCPVRLDNLEPDRAVAKGAAIHAAKLAGDKAVKVEIGSDLGSRSYGVRCVNENEELIVENVLKRTDDIILERTCTFSTHVDDQKEVCFAIYEDISVDDKVELNKCNLVEEQLLVWGFPVPQGTPIDVHISRASDGIVYVWVECKGAKIDFKIKSKGLFSQEEVEELRKSLASKKV